MNDKIISNLFKQKESFDFIKKCLKNIVDLREKPGVVDYLNLVFSVMDNYECVFNRIDPYHYFLNKKWCLLDSSINIIILNIIREWATNIEEINPHKDFKNNSSAINFIATVKDVKFGITSSIFDKSYCKIYVEDKFKSTFSEILEELFWKKYKSKHVLLGCSDESSTKEEKIYLKEDTKTENFITTENATKIAKTLQQYLDLGYSRSILFYGMPGSGKTNIVKNICYILDIKTIRIDSLNKLSEEEIKDICTIFKPDCLIIEDIDHFRSYDLSIFLSKLERFNKSVKIFFATANKPTNLDCASIRPERFDLAIKISSLEPHVVMKMVDSDQEIFDIVKEWPAASISELMKRIRVEGKEAALTSIEDLANRVKQIKMEDYELHN